MRTVQMTLDEALVKEVDAAARRLRTTRSGFTRRALREILKHLREMEMDRRHREGYLRHPVGPDEVSIWEPEQVWGD